MPYFCGFKAIFSFDKCRKPVKASIRCFATYKGYIKSKSLNSSALADFFYVNIYAFVCCLLLRFT